MSRARLAAALGVAVYAAAWSFGSEPLYPVAVGLVLAAVASRLAAGLQTGPMRLTRRFGQRSAREGDDVWVTLEVESDARLRPATLLVRERIEGLGQRETRVYRDGDRLRGSYVVERAPRGRYRYDEVEVTVEEPFGLERRLVALRAGGAIVVYPRLAEVDGLFSETGAHAQDGRRLLLRRPSGFDLHSVREYEQGESLRSVHWRTTARRGRLMVRELEDAPRDEVAVVLDADAAGAVGPRGDSSFDLAVRAAGSILLAHARRGRRAALVVTGAHPETVSVASVDGDWHAALEALAAARPDGRVPLAQVLAREAGAPGRALELAVVTSRLEPALVDRLVQRAAAHRAVSLAWVDAASFDGRPPRAEPGLLRLQAAGIPVAVLRRGDALAAALGDPRAREAAHA